MLAQYGRRHSPWGLHGGNWIRIRISGYRMLSDEASGYKNGETKDFRSRITVTVGEQIMGKMDISPRPLYNPLDGEQTLGAELIRDPVPN